MDGPPATQLSPDAAATAADLRMRFAFLREVVAELERELPYAAALVRLGDGTAMRLADGEQRASRVDPQSGIVLTASGGRTLEEAATDALDPESVRALAAALLARVRATARHPTGPVLEIPRGEPVEGDFAAPVLEDPSNLTLDDLLHRHDDLRRRLRDASSRAVQAQLGYTDRSTASVFVTRGGMATQQLRRLNLSLGLVVSDGERRQFDIILKGGTGGLEQILVTDEELARPAETAEALLTAKPPPPGIRDVITDQWTSGILAHEAFGHGVETDMFLKGRARAAEYVGRRVGSDLVTIMDDPTYPGGVGSYFVDDEGLLATPTTIIRDGIFQRGITDLYSATRLGIPRSANGRRESVQRKAYARMSNTFFAPGDRTRDELIGELDDGLLLCRTLNGMEDPKGWGIQMAAHFGREIRHGRPTGVLFAPVAMTGYVPDVLASVSGISRELGFFPGQCGKGWKELVPVSAGGPYLRTRCRVG